MNLRRWGWASIAVDALLAALHGLIALRSGSLAVAAELTHNLADLFAAVGVLVGLELAARKSKAFPYGLYKIENVVSAGLAISVFVTAYEVLRQAFGASPPPVQVDAWMLPALVATGTIPLVFGYFELRAGRAANSPALIADALEFRVHALTTGLVFVALAASRLDLPLDRIAAAVIAAVVAKTGWELLRDSMRVLLDASLDGETLAAIRRAIETDPAVIELKWITGRNAGRFRFVEAGVALRTDALDRVQAVTARIERDVRARVKHLERALIHVEAPASPSLRCAIPQADRDGTVSKHFGEAPWFALLTLRRSDGALVERRLLDNPHAGLARAKGLRVAEWLIEQRVDCVLSAEDLGGKGPAYALQNAGVELVQSGARTLDAAIADCCAARRGAGPGAVG
jgi:cation diffusion facilitator family transporter